MFWRLLLPLGQFSPIELAIDLLLTLSKHLYLSLQTDIRLDIMFCDPKVWLFLTLVSLWAVILFLNKAISLHWRSLAIAEGMLREEGRNDNETVARVAAEAQERYLDGVRACINVAFFYAAVLIISGWQFYLNRCPKVPFLHRID